MKKILFLLLFVGFGFGANQNFQTGSIDLNSSNQYITGKTLYAVQKTLYSKTEDNLQEILQNVNLKKINIQNSSIIYYKKQRLLVILDELDAIISDVIKNQQVDVDETLSDVMKD